MTSTRNRQVSVDMMRTAAYYFTCSPAGILCYSISRPQFCILRFGMLVHNASDVHCRFGTSRPCHTFSILPDLDYGRAPRDFLATHTPRPLEISTFANLNARSLLLVPSYRSPTTTLSTIDTRPTIASTAENADFKPPTANRIKI